MLRPLDQHTTKATGSMAACDVAHVVMAEAVMLAGDAENRLRLLPVLLVICRQQFGHDLGFVLTNELPQRVGNQASRLNDQDATFCPDGQAAITQLMNQTCAHG